LCWHLYLIDAKNRTVTSTFAGKYGPEEFVSWSSGESFATFKYFVEGHQENYRINLATAQSIYVEK
jgi:hypothetical protein